jgi:hypothetical protein
LWNNYQHEQWFVNGWMSSSHSDRAPLWYASLQESGVMAAALIQNGATALRFVPTREQSAILLWPDSGINVDVDVEEALKDIPEETVPQKPVVDSNAKIAHGEVLQEGDNLYDVLLTIVDIKHGAYGINNFYKMVRLFPSSF